MKNKFPKAVKACLGSYDADKMTLSNPDHRFIVIMNILNHGSMKAVDWLWKNVSEKKEITEMIKYFEAL